ncbi:proteasome complex subunit Rpn13 ubiquitin receptor-domain-containing protein [Thamnocephalis sphaerospora]|uniref:Proteasome complex subunit Rpn13 ubiquitin receptor-domain-containing protein n=1 Tax=Thamnocephalis sphaerospora TaxID=78915 RepID=A0A4P9XRZ8_9FUNG|nr:proteasome complex subunit Rpn13 ubiquitin receptor-domain-containing protein [Thamnocephalis sphaerospora]|eukprot:RKP08877.1 proteasome complex subunit Rpn13 ubiquitin receptor-domain-containing protein [Thamnocephalis sphaerospora]
MQLSRPGHLLEFKAGRMFRDGDTKWVRPDDAKGLVYLEKSDGLLHFHWKNRETGEIVEDLIIFEDDAEFFKVTQSPGRVYALRFRSSGNVLFFWMQHRDEARDEILCRRLNDYIANPDAAEVMDDQTAATGSLPSGGAAGATSGNQLGNLRELLANITVPEDITARHAAETDSSLNDVLTSEHLQPVLDDAELRAAIFPHLPEGAPHTLEEVQQVVASPQFRQSLASLSAALNSGQMVPLVLELGLPASAGSSVRAFLQAIEQLARDRADNEGDGEELQADPAPPQNEGSGDRMDED